MNCNYPQANSQHIKQNKNVSIADSIQRAFKTEFAVHFPLCLNRTTSEDNDANMTSKW